MFQETPHPYGAGGASSNALQLLLTFMVSTPPPVPALPLADLPWFISDGGTASLLPIQSGKPFGSFIPLVCPDHSLKEPPQ